ncbi:MAG: ABC transporter ATP-binding protein/permease [Polyangiaceae bacterium]
MATIPETTPSARAVRQGTPGPTTAEQFRAFVRAFWNSPSRTRVALLGVGIVVVIVGTAFAQVRLNAWNRPFYDAVERKDVHEFFRQLLFFGGIASSLLVLNVAQAWLNLTLQLRLRDWITRDLVAEWLKDKRAFKIASTSEIGANPDQRIHQDGEHLTTLSADLGIGLFQSGLLLVSFIGVLWGLSSGVVLWFGDYGISIPGYMVWCALLYSAIGSWLSWRVGRPLVTLNADRYAREADLRSALVQTYEHVDAVALYRREASEQQRLDTLLGAVLASVQRIIGASVRLTWVTAGYGWLALVVPIIVASPGYFRGHLSFGELMMVVGAFFQVQQALRWFIDRVGAIADWQATLLRVMTFRDALLDLDQTTIAGERIERALAADGHLRFETLRVATPGGPAQLSEDHVDIEPGARVLIIGEPGAGKTALFQAIAGLSSAGSGRILVPAPDETVFLSERPYVPRGPLRDALTLSAHDAATDAELCVILERVGLAHLAQSLDRSERWDHELTTADLHRLSYARLLLSKPKWVISDDGLDLLLENEGPEGQVSGILSMFQNELADSAVVSFATRSSAGDFYQRTLRLVGPGLTRGPSSGPASKRRSLGT